MKMSILKISIVLFLLPVMSKAGNINIYDAERVARNYYFEQTGVTQENIVFEKTISYMNNNKQIVYYIFDVEKDNGFVIVSAEDAYYPIIAYSNNSNFKMDGMPDHLIDLYEEYSNKITFIRNNKIIATGEISSEWAKYNIELTSFFPSKNVDAVLLTTGNWNQDGGFDDWVPTNDEGTPPVGCVATAMGIIMNYWKYPMRGTGSAAYYSTFSSQTLSVNFENSIYPWNLMDNNNSGNSYEACISYHCGVALHMSYSIDGSGSYVNWGANSAKNCFINYFKYNNSTISFQSKNNYSDTYWKQLLKTEIDNSRPMLYRGVSNDGGHAWVCDGYNNSDLFHYNFGWGGINNGYYDINNVNGFTSDNGAIIGIQPIGSNTYPNAPQNLSAGVDTDNTTDFTINLSWEAPQSKDVVNYKIFRIDYESNGYHHQIVEVADVPGNITNYLDDNLEPGEKNYIVQAIYATDESEVVDAYIQEGFNIRFNFFDTDGNPVQSVASTLSNGTYNVQKPGTFYTYATFNFVPWGDNYSITVEKPGFTTTTDNISFVNEDRIYDVILGEGLVEIENPEFSGKFNIYPNPADETLYVTIDGDVNEYKFMIYDISGKLLKTQIINSNTNKIDINRFNKGLYFLKITSEKESYTKTFIKK